MRRPLRTWKQAVRQLFRAPGFLSVAALALALGIGSTTTIFSIVRAVFLRGMIMSLLAAFAGVALVLAMFGVYSVTAYAVGQRTGEIGVRLAMGALPSQVQRMVITQGLLISISSIRYPQMTPVIR